MTLAADWPYLVRRRSEQLWLWLTARVQARRQALGHRIDDGAQRLGEWVQQRGSRLGARVAGFGWFLDREE